ncbi:hypothetical protein L6164_019297 [Bauhinia variegata]|uniref:Uncharacterized protein n=1 Tax=Bauhinia variegata TaxID=167791 RepID=A0ACB9NDR9_BAUVA|nr:hypothetical protein L6164_019297 [Bauhinia variegata]
MWDDIDNSTTLHLCRRDSASVVSSINYESRYTETRYHFLWIQGRIGAFLSCSAVHLARRGGASTQAEKSTKSEFHCTIGMYNINNVGSQPGATRPPTTSQPTPFGNAFQVTGSGLIRGGLGAYGEKIFGSSTEYVQSNISRYFSDPQYYFQVNDQYVRNKLKVVLFPFLHRGHWTRITEPVGGRLSYKPPIYDINAPDLYIPFMAFGTYVVLAGLSLGLRGKFSPDALNWMFIKGLLGWFLQATLLKTMKRVLFAEVRSYDSSKHHYLLLFIALAQFPLFTWLGNITVNWLI